MKYLLSLLITFAIATHTYGQQIVYTYDAAGNRIRQELIESEESRVRRSISTDCLPTNFADTPQVLYDRNSNIVTIILPNSKENSNCIVSMFSNEGKCFFNYEIEYKTHTISISEYPNGVYILCLSIDGIKETYKLLKS